MVCRLPKAAGKILGLCTGSSSLAFLESSSFVPATVQSASHDQLTQQITVIHTRHTALTTTSTLTLPLATALTVKSAEAGRATGTWGGWRAMYFPPLAARHSCHQYELDSVLAASFLEGWIQENT